MSPRARTSARKKPAQERSKATVNAILQATARVLVREGYDRTSTNRIASAAGVSVGSLYQYFPSKEALVAALIDDHVSRMTQMCEKLAVDLADAPLDVACRAVIRVLIDAHRIDPRLHRIVVEQVPRVGRLQRIVDLETQGRALIRAYLEVRRAEVRPRNLEIAAFLLAQVVEAVAHGAVIHEPSLLENDELVEETVDLVVRYLERP